MLQELRVSNFAIIDNLQISFQKGLNILSGETGAGKSVLLKSLGLLMGEKADATGVRTGADSAVIEGSFDISARRDVREKLESMGIECLDDSMVVRRLIASGAPSSAQKARVYINGSLSTLATLRDVVSPLVEVTGHSVPLIESTGQHDNRNLLSKAYHLELLDQYAGTAAGRTAFELLFRRRQEIERSLSALRSSNRERAQKLDFLIFSRDEIRSLELQSGDEVAIESDAKRVKYAARLLEYAGLVESSLESDDAAVLSQLKRLVSRAHELRGIDPSLVDRLAPISQASLLLQDVALDMRRYGEALEVDPERLEELEARLSRLRQLQKKYGPTADSILEELAKIENEIHDLEASDDRIESLDAEYADVVEKMLALGHDLHRRRNEAAVLFTREVNAELLDLNMKGVEFVTSIELVEGPGRAPLSTGLTDLEFMTRTSRGDVARPLAKAASGGELSRILLSVKRAVGTSAQPRTYLFDEVDTGVSGETAEKVGRKLKAIATGQQVICVTHLPQVACCGDVHFYIEKSSPEKSSAATAVTSATATASSGAAMTVTELKGPGRVREVARLISGEKLSSTSLAHAEQLLAEQVAEQAVRRVPQQDERKGTATRSVKPVKRNRTRTP